MLKREPFIKLRDPGVWRLVATPARSQIVDMLRFTGPCTVAEMARALERPADTLYKHIYALCEAGFVRQVEIRKTGRHAEMVYDVTADAFLLDFEGMTPEEENRAVARAVTTLLGTMERTVNDAAAAEALVAKSAGRNISVTYEVGWLTPDQYQQVRGLLRQIKSILDAGRLERAGTMYASLAVVCPLKRRGRGARDDEPEPRNGTGPAGSGDA